MNIFNLKKDEFKKENKEFRKTYLGKNLNSMRISVGFLFIIVFAQELYAVYNGSLDITYTLVLLCAVLLYVIIEFLYYMLFNSYYKDKKVVSKK